MKLNNPMKNEEIRKRAGLTKRGKPLSEETKQKISASTKGKKRSPEFSEKLSNVSKNRLRDSKGHFIKTKD